MNPVKLKSIDDWRLYTVAIGASTQVVDDQHLRLAILQRQVTRFYYKTIVLYIFGTSGSQYYHFSSVLLLTFNCKQKPQ